jgi:hypothetical protein
VQPDSIRTRALVETQLDRLATTACHHGSTTLAPSAPSESYTILTSAVDSGRSTVVSPPAAKGTSQ